MAAGLEHSEQVKSLIMLWNQEFPYYPITIAIYDADKDDILDFVSECIHNFRELSEGQSYQRVPMESPRRLVSCVVFLREICEQMAEVNCSDLFRKNHRRRSVLITHAMNWMVRAKSIARSISEVHEQVRGDAEAEDKRLRDRKERLIEEVNRKVIREDKLKFQIKGDAETCRRLEEENCDLMGRIEAEQARLSRVKDSYVEVRDTVSQLKKRSAELHTKVALAECMDDHREIAEENASLKTVLDLKQKSHEHYVNILEKLGNFRIALDKSVEIEGQNNEKEKLHKDAMKKIKEEVTNLKVLIASMDKDCRNFDEIAREKIAREEKYENELKEMKAQLLQRDANLLKEKHALRNKFVAEMKGCRLIQKKLIDAVNECESLIKHSTNLYLAKITALKPST